jgi:hypothetical protein
MIQFFADYWWVFLVVFLLTIPTLVISYRERRTMKAQFLPAIGCLGCLMGGFNVVGLVSGVLGVVSGLIRLFLWKVGG